MSISVLFISVIFVVTANSRTSLTCNETNPCQGHTLHCESSGDCRVICSESYSCEDISIYCPSNYECYIDCSAQDSCSNAYINATTSSHLHIIAGVRGLDNARVYCPNDGPFVNSESINCVFQGIDRVSFRAINIYAVEGFHDVFIECSHNNCVRDAKIHCEIGYSSKCNISEDTFNDCDSIDGRCTNFALTPNPTSYPIYDPTSSPTYDPTSVPTIAPTLNTIQHTLTSSISQIAAPTSFPSKQSSTNHSIATPTQNATANPTSISDQHSTNNKRSIWIDKTIILTIIISGAVLLFLLVFTCIICMGCVLCTNNNHTDQTNQTNPTFRTLPSTDVIVGQVKINKKSDDESHSTTAMQPPPKPNPKPKSTLTESEHYELEDDNKNVERDTCTDSDLEDMYIDIPFPAQQQFLNGDKHKETNKHYGELPNNYKNEEFINVLNDIFEDSEDDEIFKIRSSQKTIIQYFDTIELDLNGFRLMSKEYFAQNLQCIKVDKERAEILYDKITSSI